MAVKIHYVSDDGFDYQFPLNPRARKCIVEKGYVIGKLIGEGVTAQAYEEDYGFLGRAVILLQGNMCIASIEDQESYTKKLRRIRDEQREGDLGDYTVKILDLIDCPYPLVDDPRYCEGQTLFPIPIQILEYAPRKLCDYILLMEQSTKITTEEKTRIEGQIIKHAKALIRALRDRGWVHTDPNLSNIMVPKGPLHGYERSLEIY